MTAIKVSNLSRKFKLYGSSGKRAMEYMTVGIIGQNGSGKSTLLSILAGA